MPRTVWTRVRVNCLWLLVEVCEGLEPACGRCCLRTSPGCVVSVHGTDHIWQVRASGILARICMQTHEIVRVLYALMMMYTCWLHICMYTQERERVRERTERGTGRECIHTRESA